MRRLLISIAMAAAMAAASPALAAPPPMPKEVSAQVELALKRLDEKDEKGAREAMERAAASGHPDAVAGLATFIHLGIGGAPDEARAEQLFEKAAKDGSSVAKVNLGNMLLDRDGRAAQERGARLLMEGAEDPEAAPTAYFGIGRAYYAGRGVEQSWDKALYYLEYAIQSDPNHGDALFLTARLREAGLGGKPADLAEAARLYRRAAEAGHARASWHYGMMLLNGDGVRADEAEAWKWVRRSGEAGDVNGQTSTAVMLALGQGVAENDAEARVWYERAARQGSPNAMKGYGGMLMTGEGGTPNRAKGRALIELAAEAGDGTAKRMLAAAPFQVEPGERAAVQRERDAWIRENGRPTPD